MSNDEKVFFTSLAYTAMTSDKNDSIFTFYDRVCENMRVLSQKGLSAADINESYAEVKSRSDIGF